MRQIDSYLLTICIATYNRSEYLEKTLVDIASQTNSFDDVEILIADGNSTDLTEFVCKKFIGSHRNITYIKLKEKGGVDRDYDLAVQNAKGKYCWLFTDDDHVKAGAVDKIRKALVDDIDLVIINSEICDYKLNRILKDSAVNTQKNLSIKFMGSGRDEFFKLCGTYITFIGAIVIKRSLWVESSRDVFYGTRFIHVGVISKLHDHTKSLVMAEPLIKIRLGNAEWTQISFKVWTQLWPNLIWSITGIKDSTKKFICLKEPSNSLKFLFWLRGLGSYSKKEFDGFISAKPRSIAKVMAFLIASMPQSIPLFIYYIYGSIKKDKLVIYQVMEGRESKNLWFSTE